MPATIELPHPTGQIRLRRLDQHMIVVIHQTVGMAKPPKTANYLAEDRQPSLTIRIRLDDALPRMAMTGHMVNRGGEFKTKWVGHGGITRSQAMSYGQI